MPTPTRSRSRLNGPKIKLPEGTEIPLARNSSSVRYSTLRGSKPPAWLCETTPHVHDLPQNANRYKRVFDVGLYRRNVWQFMFGGLLRSIFGVYSPHRYWDRQRDDALLEQLKKEYAETKRKGLYGIYTFQALKTVTLRGRRWYDSKPPLTSRQDNLFLLPKNHTLYVRVDRMDEEDFADIEFLPRLSTNQAKLPEETLILRIAYKDLQWLVSNKKIKRLPDGKIYELKKQRRTESDEKEASLSSRRLHRLRKANLPL